MDRTFWICHIPRKSSVLVPRASGGVLICRVEIDRNRKGESGRLIWSALEDCVVWRREFKVFPRVFQWPARRIRVMRVVSSDITGFVGSVRFGKVGDRVSIMRTCYNAHRQSGVFWKDDRSEAHLCTAGHCWEGCLAYSW